MRSILQICKTKPPYLNFQRFIGPSSIYVARQQRTKWNHQANYFSYLSVNHIQRWDKTKLTHHQISMCGTTCEMKVSCWQFIMLIYNGQVTIRYHRHQWFQFILQINLKEF
jgi:hypothetical protein